MIISINIGGKTWKIAREKPLNISIPLDFHGAQPNIYDVEPATATAFEGGNFIGDTRRGGSCNFENVRFTPHCNGTHTECVGHLTRERISVHECLREAFFLAQLISVNPEKAFESNETYSIELYENDELITRRSLENSALQIESENIEALIIRTLPNSSDKKIRRYSENPPPFFSAPAMEFIVECGVKHLLVDLPSIDRMFDDGKLANHRIFWNVAPDSFEINENTRIYNTITEMIFVPNEIPDGVYLLNLQIAPFVSDAAPARPVVFELFA